MKIIIKIWVFFFTLLLSQDHWETAIFADDIWRYNVPDTELASDWNTNSFNDGFWTLGQGGFGYGDGDDGTVLDQATSVYFRKSFNVGDITKLSKAILNADYDDGFVAYLNGVEIARSDNLSNYGTIVPFDASTSYDHEAALYSCLLYTSPSPRDRSLSRMPSSA